MTSCPVIEPQTEKISCKPKAARLTNLNRVLAIPFYNLVALRSFSLADLAKDHFANHAFSGNSLKYSLFTVQGTIQRIKGSNAPEFYNNLSRGCTFSPELVPDQAMTPNAIFPVEKSKDGHALVCLGLFVPSLSMTGRVYYAKIAPRNAYCLSLEEFRNPRKAYTLSLEEALLLPTVISLRVLREQDTLEEFMQKRDRLTQALSLNNVNAAFLLRRPNQLSYDHYVAYGSIETPSVTPQPAH